MPAPKIRSRSPNADQTELNGVPVQSRQLGERLTRLQPRTGFTICLHVGGIRRIGEQRNMSENIVEHVRLLEIVQLRGGANEAPGNEAPIRQMVEEDLAPGPAPGQPRPTSPSAAAAAD